MRVNLIIHHILAVLRNKAFWISSLKIVSDQKSMSYSILELSSLPRTSFVFSDNARLRLRDPCSPETPPLVRTSDTCGRK